MWGIEGHEWAVELLSRSVASGRVSHAYLITGPSHIGKATLALTWAKVLNCQGDVAPCDSCTSCRKVDRGVHPDVRVISGATESIKIDQIRALQREASLRPMEGRYRIHILTEAQRATPEAANCLLKTLEEPPASEVLVLTAAGGEQLLPTVVSRCQVIALRLVSSATVRRSLAERWGVEAGRAERLARLAGGRIGWAISASQDPGILSTQDSYVTGLLSVLGGDQVARWQYARRVARKSDEILPMLAAWKGWWRQLLLWKAGCVRHVADPDFGRELGELETGLSLQQIQAALRAIQATMEQLQQNANPLLALEVLLLALPRQRYESV